MVEPPRWADVMLAVQQVGERQNRTLSELMHRGGLHHSELYCRLTTTKSAVIKHADDDARVRHAPESLVRLADG